MEEISKFIDIVISKNIKFVSFDVFDTVITRNVINPTDVFEKIKIKLKHSSFNSESILVKNFVPIRIESESYARKIIQREDIRIDEIYEVIALSYGLDQQQTDFIKLLEHDAELQSVVPVKPILELIDELREKGLRIIFISDMYLSEQFIKKLLLKVGAYCGEDYLYVSETRRLTKRSGLLFQHVLEDLGLSVGDIAHFGDNRWSDYIMPKKIGIEAVHFNSSKINNFERLISFDKNDHSKIGCQALAGASRAGRLCFDRSSLGLERDLFVLGANVVGPILFGYVFWILQMCEILKIKRLYFQSRDGQILLLIAKVLINKLSLDIQPSYLYVSRLSTNICNLKADQLSDCSWLTAPNSIISIRVLAGRLNINVDKLLKYIKNYGYKVGDYDKSLSKLEVAKILGRLEKNDEFNKFLDEHIASHRFKLKQYLEQEGLFCDDKIAVVDLGWSGTIQDNIYDIIAENKYDKKLNGFYFGLSKYKKKSSNLKYGYLFNEKTKVEELSYVNCFNVLMEIFCLADHGMVQGYAFENSRVVPFFREMEDENNVNKILSLRKGVFSFLDKLDYEFVDFYSYDFRYKTLNLLKFFYFNANYKYINAISGFTFSGDQGGNCVKKFSPPVRIRDAISYYFKPNLGEKSQITYWLYGSYMMSGLATKVIWFPIICYFRIIFLSKDKCSSFLLNLIQWYGLAVKRIRT